MFCCVRSGFFGWLLWVAFCVDVVVFGVVALKCLCWMSVFQEENKVVELEAASSLEEAAP